MPKVFALCAAPARTKADEPLHTIVTKEIGNMLKIIFLLEGGRVPDRNARGWTVDGGKRRYTRT